MLTSTTAQPVYEFLSAEMDLLDTWELRAWLELFTSDGIYWLPADPEGPRTRQNAIVFDDRSQREIRVDHLLLDHLAQVPRSRTLHVMSNVKVVEDAADVIIVRANVVVFETRPGQIERVQPGRGAQRALPGQYTYVLERAAASWKIAEKKIVLLTRDEAHYNLSFVM